MKKKRTGLLILGVHHGHESGACIVQSDRILADVSEERFARVKHCSDVPRNSIKWCLKQAGVGSINDVDVIAIAGSSTSRGLSALFGLPTEGLKARVKEKAFTFGLPFGAAPLATPLYMEECKVADRGKIVNVGHHLAHAASAHFTRPDLSPALVFTIDGRGEGVCTAVWRADGPTIVPLQQLGREAAIGYAYSAVTEALGWWHGDGEGKTMGLAPYGDPGPALDDVESLFPRFEGTKLSKATRLSDPVHWPEMAAIHYHMEEASRLRERTSGRGGRENLAAAAQEALETVVSGYVSAWAQKEKVEHLAFSGGVFLNVKLNQRIWEMRDGVFDEQHIYPNCGDSGLAVGAALYAAAQLGTTPGCDFRHLYLGPAYSDDEIERSLREFGIGAKRTADPAGEAARMLAEDQIVGWFQGRMEAGPRALGNRSILMSPLRSRNKDIINATVKFREAFRPFCPSLPAEERETYLKDARNEHFMITSFDVRAEKRDRVPAVVHVDGTVRPQLVRRDENELFWRLIRTFGDLTGEPIVLNTSFNVRGEPIICSPADALRCFFSNGLDALIMGNFVIKKTVRPARP